MADDLREVAASGSEEHRGHDVFVSYSRADRASVVELTERLTTVGKRAWVDLEDIPPSAEWMAEIRGAIAAADAYLVVVSPDLARSSVCAEELDGAVAGGKRIVPVLIRSTDPATVPDALARLNWIDATDGDLDRTTEQIVRALDTDLEHVKAHTRLLVRATEWEAAGERRSALLRGRELADAEHLTADAEREPRPTQLQTRFVLASRKATGRRQRAVVAATSVALVVAIALGSVALIQGGEARRQRTQALEQRDLARSSGLASATLATIDQDPELSLLLALEAARIHPSEQVEGALREAINASNIEVVFRGHDGEVGDVAFAPDGHTMVSVGQDSRILIWDAPTGTVSHDIPPAQGVLPIVFDPDGEWIAAGLSDGEVAIRDAATGDIERMLHTRDLVSQVEVTPDGDLLIASADDGARVWRTDTWEQVVSIPSAPSGTYMANLSPSGDLIATANGDGSIGIFDGNTGHLIRTLEGHRDLAYAVQFDGTGERLLSVGFDRMVRVWDVRTGEELSELLHDLLISSAEFVGRDYIVTFDNSSVGRIWDLVSGGIASELRGHTAFGASVAVGPTADRVASTSDDGTVRIWRLGPGVSHLQVHRDGFVSAAEFAPDGTVVTAGDTGQVETWDAGSSELRRIVFDEPDATTTVLDVSIRGDQTVVAYRRERHGSVVAGGVAFVDPTQGTRTSDYVLQDSGYPLTVAEDASGDQAISVWSDGAVRITNAEGRLVAEYPITPPPTDRLGVSGGSTVRSLHTANGCTGASGEWRRCVRDSVQDSLAEFFPDGARAAVVNGGSIDVVDLATGSVERSLDTGGVPVLTLAVSPDGTRVAGGMNDSSVRIWDADSGEQTADLRGHRSYLASVAFSPDGDFVVSAALDGTARVWTLDGREIQRVQAAEFVVTSARFSADGTQILVGGLTGSRPVPVETGYDPPHGGVVRIYDCDVCRSFDDLVALARSRVTRQLTEAELRTYLGRS